MVSINGITVATIEYNVDRYHCGVPIVGQIYVIEVNITYLLLYYYRPLDFDFDIIYVLASAVVLKSA